LFEDIRGHAWISIEPQNDERCARCGLPWLQARDFPCNPAVAGPSGSGTADLQAATEHAVSTSRAALAPASSPRLTVLPGSPRVATMEARWETVEAEIRKMFEDDLAVLKERAFEYGSDLRIQGKAMETLLPGADEMSSANAAAAGIEMVIGSYVMGKAARLFGAWEKGNAPRLDSWRDMSNFSFMARFVRAFGEWL
jgi:hypothetical protein